MELTIYKEGKNELSPMKFIQDVKNQVAIRDLDVKNPYFSQQLGLILTKTHNLLGLKSVIEDINKADIKEMILMRFKGLSLNELDYAFKLERYGLLGAKTNHFQLFNADYVSDVLDKYKEWKLDQIKKIKVNGSEDLKLSEEEIIEKENSIVKRFLHEYEFTRKVEDEYFYVFDIFRKRGLIQLSKEKANEIKQKAIKIVEQEENQNKKYASTKREFNEINYKLKQISLGKNGLVKSRAKVIALYEFLENVYSGDVEEIDLKLKSFFNT